MCLYFNYINTKQQQQNIMSKNLAEEYWKKNLKYLLILLSIWFTVSFGFGIILIEELNQIKIGGFKLGFWFAQQGSIYVFVTLIFIYIYLMNRLDKKYHSKK
jgi:putative solute:sodium symporter small subunit